MSEDAMDVRGEEVGDELLDKSSSEEDSSLRRGLRRLSISPPRHRTESPSPAWIANTTSPPPPPSTHLPMRPRVETPVSAVIEGSSMPRTLSSPSLSLMDSSPPAKKSPVPHSPATFQRKSGKVSANAELTPITRNTGGCFVDEQHVVVSPDDGMEAPLHGESLALPSHVGFADGQLQQRRSSAPSLPPLHMAERAKSMGSILQQTDSLEDENEAFEPVKFPSDRKYCHYSFTTANQFSQSTNSPRSLQQQGSGGLVPYQPTREDTNVGSFPDTVLGGIFQHSPASASIPLDERQFSIPSIHLAHHLNGSTTSYTDEEDDLLHNDEASLSSRGSSLYMPGEDADDAGSAKPLRLNVSAAKMAFRHEEEEATTEEEAIAAAAAFAPPETLHDSDNDADKEQDDDEKKQHRSSKRKSAKRKERQAIEWLRSVDATNQDISEAASSKFLTSSRRQASSSHAARRRYHRNASSPALEEQLAGAFPPPSDTFPPPTH